MPLNQRIIKSTAKTYFYRDDNLKITVPIKIRMTEFNQSYAVQLGAKKPMKKQNLIKMLEDFRASRRAKTTIKDIAICNKFELFCTFTFNCQSCKPKCDNKPCICNPDTCTRNNIDLCKMKMMRWIYAQKRKYGKFEYIFVPEYHHDKKAIHFHALIKNYCGPMSDSGIVQSTDRVYNFMEYTLGYSSAKYINNGTDDDERVANYLTKYITKDMPQFSGKKRYWVSQDMTRPYKEVNVNYHQKIDSKSNMIYCATSVVYKNNEFTIFEWRKRKG